MYSYFSILPYTLSLPLIFCCSTYISSSSGNSSSIKSFVCKSNFFCIYCRTHSWRNANITSCITSRSMWVNTSEFAGKDSTEIVSCRYSFLTFFIPLLICTWYLHFHGEVLDIYEELFYGYHSLPFKPYEKILLVTLTLLFLSFILYLLTGFFMNVKSFLGRKSCQLKVLKVLLMYLY